MPELPEVETVRRGLQASLAGQTITQVEILDDRLTRRSDLDVRSHLEGQQVEGWRRRGKWLTAQLANHLVLVMHLRMSGQLIIQEGQHRPALRPPRATIDFDNGIRLDFIDQRRFGELLVMSEAAAEDRLSALGPDADTVSASELRQALANRKLKLKSALTNQAIVAGIGNMYADEILWRAQLDWRREAGSLTAEEVETLAAETRQTLAEAIKAGGTSTKDGLYVNTAGETGWFAVELATYQKTGQPCPRCGTPIIREKTGSVGTHYCPTCQGG